MKFTIAKSMPLILLVAACASTVVTDVYRDPAPSYPRFQRIVAIALTDNAEARREAEDELVRRIGDRASASYSVLTADDERDPAAVRARLRSAGFDGAVVMSLLSASEEPLDVSGVYPDAYKQFTGYYGSNRGNAANWEEVVRVETEIFSVADDKLLWSGATKTFETTNVKSVVASVAKAVSAELRKSGLIQE